MASSRAGTESFMQRITKLGNNSAAREQMSRVIQYGCLGLSDVLKRIDTDNYGYYINRLSSVVSHVTTARKMMRLGKSIDVLRCLQLEMRIKGWLLFMIILTVRLTSFFYLLADHVIWLIEVDALTIDPSPVYTIYNQLWVTLCVLSLLRNVYACNMILRRHWYNSSKRKSRKKLWIPVVLDTVVNLLDLLIPMHELQHWNVAGFIRGSAGVVSSIITLATIANADLALRNV